MPPSYSVYPNNELKKPKRCLTAYNFFFQHERQCLLDSLPVRFGVKSSRSHGKIQFAELARIVSSKWKGTTLDAKAPFNRLAEMDKLRYDKEMKDWKARLAGCDSTRASPVVSSKREARESPSVTESDSSQSVRQGAFLGPLSFDSQEPQFELDEKCCDFILSALK
eukprot:scaffold22572_cov107-Amphora_coffeaeformis.AAC.1